jgi:hypothetical protein
MLGAVVSASVLLMVTLGGIGINRVRNTRRFRAVIDAYADKQIAQQRVSNGEKACAGNGVGA